MERCTLLLFGMWCHRLSSYQSFANSVRADSETRWAVPAQAFESQPIRTDWISQEGGGAWQDSKTLKWDLND